MVVAVIAVRMVQMPGDEVVDVIAVRHGLVPATGPVYVCVLMAAAVMPGRALVRILRADRDPVLVDMAAMRMVQVAIVQVIDMALVQDRRVAAMCAVLVVVVGVVGLIAGAHALPLFDGGRIAGR